MSEADGFQPRLDFEAAEGAAQDGEALIVDVDGYEGPLHVLLALARSQKVDMLRISVTRLADQYLAFVQQARRHSFALAADYLVMASWLAFLKSRLLLPRPERPQAEEAPAEEVAAQLEVVGRICEDQVHRPVGQALQDLDTVALENGVGLDNGIGGHAQPFVLANRIRNPR